ncbi:unnamed protein product, partial [Rotaria magnacalcarata]
MNELAKDITIMSKDVGKLIEALCGMKKDDQETLIKISQELKKIIENSPTKKIERNKKKEKQVDKKVSEEGMIKGAIQYIYHKYKDTTDNPVFQMNFKPIFDLNKSINEDGLKSVLNINETMKQMEQLSKDFEGLSLLPKFVNSQISYLVKLEK